MSDLISRQDAVNEIHKYFVEEIDKTPVAKDEDGDEVYTDMPTVNSLLACNKELSKRIKALPSAGQNCVLCEYYTEIETDDGIKGKCTRRTGSDLISRQDAIEKIKKHYNLLEGATMQTDVARRDELSAIMAMLFNLPSADRPTGWIPVSERLPKVGEDVLFSIDTMYVSEGCLRDDGDWWQFRWNSVQPKKYVIAWMPLPEPYDCGAKMGGDSDG